MMHAAASDATVSSKARSAPFQYGLEVSACQKMWVSKVASTRVPSIAYFTSVAGICCFAASFLSVPFFFSVLIADLSAAPSFVSDFR